MEYRRGRHFDICVELGLSTVYRIDGITVTIYGCWHHTVKALSTFEPYTATAQLTLYFMAVDGRKYSHYCLSVLHHLHMCQLGYSRHNYHRCLPV